MYSSSNSNRGWTNYLGIPFVEIPPGTCIIGAHDNDVDANDNERPVHKITISRNFYMAAWPLTLGDYLRFCKYQKREYGSFLDDQAVNFISCNEADSYIARLNAERPLSERDVHYRLPTEYEWEYACRAGSSTRFYFGDDWMFEELANYAWYDECAWNVGLRHPQAVAQKRPNEFGLWDMHGNVWEWTSDGWASYNDILSYGEGIRNGNYRVLRGGAFCHEARYIRASDRDYYEPSYKHYYTGFRLCADKRS